MQLLMDNIGSIVVLKDGKSWSKDKLSSEVAKRSMTLSSLGIKQGDRILILHGGSAEFFADLFAVWNIGACAACINPDSTISEIKIINKFIKPKLALISNNNSNLVNVNAVNLTDNTVVDSTLHKSSRIDDDALILFTSGTTGVPKGVVHTFRSLLSRIVLNQKEIPEKDMEVTLSPLPTHFGHGLIGNCLTPLLTGKQLILASGGDIGFIAKLGEVIDKYGVTFMSSVPSMWKIAIKMSHSPKMKTLRRIHIGSAPLSADLWKNVIVWAGIRTVVNMYGITETANWIAGASADDFDPEDGLVGHTWGGFAAIYKDNGDFLSHGKGEILVQNPSIMSGYYLQEKLNNEALLNGWFRTGDIGTIDKKGVIRITGRKKFEINRAGLKIHPEDIDILLEQHPSINEACAFAIPDTIAGEIVGVAICYVEGKTIDINELESWCIERLVKEKVPEKWFILTEIPKTDRGKINRDIVASACLNKD
jgi:oxalate---CoA ligase